MAARVRIGSARDAAEAALVRAVLTAHDLHVHISGEHHAALVGLGQSAIEQVIWVDAEVADEATALLRELREGGEAVLADGEVPDDDASERSDEAEPGGALITTGADTLTRLGATKRLALAILLGLTLTLGTAHLSTRAWKRGLALAAIELVGWFRAAAGQTHLGAALIGGAILADIIGASWQITRPAAPIAAAIVHRRG